MTIPEPLLPVIIVEPDILGGAPCFKGTRVPLETLLDHIEIGQSLDQFLSGYPSVKREHAQTVLEWMSSQSRKTIGLDLAS